MICSLSIDDDCDDSQSSDNIYNVEFVYGKKLQKQKPLYAVKWIGFSIKQMTWEPRSNFTSQSLYLIQRFESRLAYQHYQKYYNPKQGTIRVHVTQRYCQIYMNKNTHDCVTKISNEKKIETFDNEYDKAQQIIDEWKKTFGFNEEKQQMQKLSKSGKKEKKQIHKLSKIIQSSSKSKTNSKNKNIDGDLERDIQLLIERDKKKNQQKKNTSSKDEISRKKTIKPASKMKSKKCEQIRNSYENNNKNSKEESNKKEKNENPYDIEINLSDDEQVSEPNPQKTVEVQKNQTEKSFPVIKSAPKNISETIIEINNYKDQKCERDYLNDIIVTQRKRELEIYRSGNLIEVIKKDSKVLGQTKTSQQLQQEIQRIQLEKIANNKPARCCVPIVPKLKDQEIQVNDLELATVQEKNFIERITSHDMMNNTLFYKCLLENGEESKQEYQGLSNLCPKTLLDYMKVNSILI